MRRAIAVLTLASVLASGCAVRGAAPRVQPDASAHPSAAPVAGQVVRGLEAWRDFARQLAVGTRINVATVDGTDVRAVLMSAGEAGITVSRRTRIPEPPFQIAYESIAAIEIDHGSSVGKMVAIAVGAAAATTAAILLLLIASIDD